MARFSLLRTLLRSLLLSTCLFTSTAQAEAPFSFAQTPGKLPKDVLPIEYVVRLVPDVANGSFQGEETVEIEVFQATKKIVFNSANIDIDAASLRGPEVAMQDLTPVLDVAQQTLSFALEKSLAPGRYFLHLQFRGKIRPQAHGLFSMQYAVDGVPKQMIASTLEPVDARSMLPSWDEPAFRAKFRLSVDVPKAWAAYSNMTISQQEALPNGKQRIVFGVTPKMASYLLVLVAGELERISVKQNGVDIGIVTTKGKLEQGRFALAASGQLLPYFNHYFALPYPLPKLDHIAIPGGFNGAMENWGGIVYNEATLLYDAQRSPPTRKNTVFSIIAHETAHQWFGDLVTMGWWDNLWLNEGFASWMGEKATHHFHPEWQVRLANLADRDRVLKLDARKTTHPIQTAIDTEEQAESAFDEITYGKGQAFLEMLESYLGEDTFRAGIRLYMQRHQYGNTTSADLWAALSTASGKNVAQLANSWTTQAGFPLISVSQTCQQGQRHITFTQRHFVADGSAPRELLWPVPLQYGVLGGKANTLLLDSASRKVTVEGCAGSLLVDPQGVGFFRLHYDAASLASLAADLPSLPDAARLKLLSDVAALASAKQLPLASYLALLEKMQNEERYAIWDSMLSQLSNWRSLLAGAPEEAQLRSFIIRLTQNKFSALGWQEKAGETVEAQQLRVLLAQTLAEAGELAVITQAQTRFLAYVRAPESLPLSLLDFVVSSAGRYANAEIFGHLQRLAKASNATEERNRYLSAMGLAQDPALAARALQLALAKDLPSQSVNHLVRDIGRNQHQQLAWDFASSHREELLQRQEPLERNHYFSRIVNNSTAPQDASMLEAYAKQFLGAEAQAIATRTAALIRARALEKQTLLAQWPGLAGFFKVVDGVK